MVDARADYGEGVVHIGEVEQGFALDVGFGDVGRVEGRRVVVEGAEEVVVILEGFGVGCGHGLGGGIGRGLGMVGACGLDGGVGEVVGHVAEKRGWLRRGWRRRLRGMG